MYTYIYIYIYIYIYTYKYTYNVSSPSPKGESEKGDPINKSLTSHLTITFQSLKSNHMLPDPPLRGKVISGDGPDRAQNIFTYVEVI